MAGKSRRVASRQGELSRRRKRTQRGPSGIPAAPARPQPQPNSGGAGALAVEGAGTGGAASVAVPQQDTPAQAPAATERPSPQSAVQPRGQGRPRGERPAAYNYVGSELRRIGLLSTVVLAALIVISIVL